MAVFARLRLAVALTFAGLTFLAGSRAYGALTTTPYRVPNWAAESMGTDHSVTQTEAVADARLFEVMTALKSTYRGKVSQMKAANPSLIILGYLNGVFVQKGKADEYPSSWFARDANGNRIISIGFQNYMMNPSNTGWITNRANECANLIGYSGYDGCMVDMLGTAPLEPGYASAFPINLATGKIWTHGDWLKATANIAGAVKTRVAPKYAVANGLGSGARYFEASAPTKQLTSRSDGGIAEAWIRAASHKITSYRPESEWKQDVDALVDAGTRGKSILTLTKTWVDGTVAQKNSIHKYALASFLLGGDGKSYFSFSYKKDADPTLPHPWWNASIGTASGAYAKASGVYQRTFTKGKVLVNPTANTYTVSLGGTYVDLNGTSRTSVTLKPNTGEVLAK